jgi:MFS family permease
MAGVGVLLIVVLSRELRNVPAKLLVLMMTAFVDMAGLFIIIPLVPFYAVMFQERGETLFGMHLDKGLLTGMVVSSFTVAQLVSAPFWGRVSDRFGRRPVMLVALTASAFAYLLFGFADSLWMLLLSRVVQGAGGGMVGVIQAYVADSVEPSQRARALGWLSASTNLGVALGPVLGSGAIALSGFDLIPGDVEVRLGSAAPGIAAAVLCLVNAVFAARFLRETGIRHPKGHKRPSVISAVSQVVANPWMPTSRIMLIYAIAIGSAHGINPLLALFLNERFGVDEFTIGYLFMYIGSVSVFARVLVLGRLVDRLGEVQVSRIGICLLSAAFLALPLVDSIGMLALVIACHPIGMALTFPCMTSLLSRIVPQEDRGMYMGVQQTFAGLARVCAPLLYGQAFDLYGGGAPFWSAGCVVLATLLLGIGLKRALDSSTT